MTPTERTAFLDTIKSINLSNISQITTSEPSNHLNEILMEYQEQINFVYDNYKYGGECRDVWQIESSVLYAITLITTIGIKKTNLQYNIWIFLFYLIF